MAINLTSSGFEQIVTKMIGCNRQLDRFVRLKFLEKKQTEGRIISQANEA
jgi:hypothetical protein